MSNTISRSSNFRLSLSVCFALCRRHFGLRRSFSKSQKEKNIGPTHSQRAYVQLVHLAFLLTNCSTALLNEEQLHVCTYRGLTSGHQLRISNLHIPFVRTLPCSFLCFSAASLAQLTPLYHVNACGSGMDSRRRVRYTRLVLFQGEVTGL